MTPDCDLIVLGSGQRGLGVALGAIRQDPDQRVLVVDRAPQPGGQTRTQRSNGFACELGPFAFTRDEVQPLLDLLRQPPTLVALRPEARTGHVFTGTGLVPVDTDPQPISFASGCEELVQACRRELGTRLHLGREATRAEPATVASGTAGWVVELGGEAPTRLTTCKLVLALPLSAAADLLARLDPELAPGASRIRTEPRAFAFFGGHAGDAPEQRGYGIVAADGLDSPLAEVIFCTQAFAGRALPGRFLVRCEVAGPLLAGDDHAVLAGAEAELRRWTGLRAAIGFTKLHRFAVDVEDGAVVECRVRLRGIAGRTPGLTVL